MHETPFSQGIASNDPWKEDFWKNIMDKGENAGNQHFLLFPQCFLPNLRQAKSFNQIQPFPKHFQTEEFADNNFKFDENGRKFTNG